MNDIIRRMLNPDTPLQRRLFQLLSAIALTEFIIVSIYTIVSGGDLIHNAEMLIGTPLYALTVAVTFKTGKFGTGSLVSAIIYYTMYLLTFFPSGGMYGGSPVTFTFALVYVFLVTQGLSRVLCLAACVGGTGVCYFYSVTHPELLDRHTMVNEHIESFLSIMLVTLLLCTLFAFVTWVYLTENQIVQKQKKEIEDLNRAQKRFFSSMSHEIRTPVNAIIGLNEVNMRENIPDNVRENMQSIEVACKNLMHTINEILDMASLETGGLKIMNADYRTTAMLSDIVSMTWLRAREKGLAFDIHLDPALPSGLHGDEIRIKQVLLNVISNAVKYTKEGSVVLKISGRENENNTILMRYEVADTGIGIRPEAIPGLFSAFQRVDEENTHAIEGTGLGLSIVKQLLDQMDGTVNVTSEYGKGSVFCIEIPQKISDPTPIGTVDLRKSEQSKGSALQNALTVPGLKILCVDDTPMNLMVIKKLLKDSAATVDTASSGGEALRKTAETRYDIILMDHQMPEMDGIECLHRIREQEGGMCRESKIVCLTANAGAEMEQLYMQEGFDGYLAKPVRGKTLEAELIRLYEEP